MVRQSSSSDPAQDLYSRRLDSLKKRDNNPVIIIACLFVPFFTFIHPILFLTLFYVSAVSHLTALIISFRQKSVAYTILSFGVVLVYWVLSLMKSL